MKHCQKVPYGKINIDPGTKLKVGYQMSMLYAVVTLLNGITLKMPVCLPAKIILKILLGGNMVIHGSSSINVTIEMIQTAELYTFLCLNIDESLPKVMNKKS